MKIIGKIPKDEFLKMRQRGKSKITEILHKLAKLENAENLRDDDLDFEILVRENNYPYAVLTSL